MIFYDTCPRCKKVAEIDRIKKNFVDRHLLHRNKVKCECLNCLKTFFYDKNTYQQKVREFHQG